MAVLAMAKPPTVEPTNVIFVNQTIKIQKCPAQQNVETVVYDGYEFKWSNQGELSSMMYE